MAPVTLPRYVIFKGDNGLNLCLCSCEGYPYLMFNSTDRNMWAAHEVLPLPEMESVVRIKALYNDRWWRMSPNWIFADQEAIPDENNLNCLFKVKKVGTKTVVLQNLGNNNYLKRLTTEGKTSALNAAVDDYRNNVLTQLEVSEALLKREIFDVEYLMDEMDSSGSKDVVLATTTAKNRSNYKTDVSSTLGYSITNTSSWSNSVSITTGVTATVTAGIPGVGDASMSVSTESSFSTEMGGTVDKSQNYNSTFTVKDVNPGEKVTLKVSGTQAVRTIPYKYKYRDTRVDNCIMEVETGFDGIYKGVQVYDVNWEAISASGARKEVEKKT